MEKNFKVAMSVAYNSLVMEQVFLLLVVQFHLIIFWPQRRTDSINISELARLKATLCKALVDVGSLTNDGAWGMEATCGVPPKNVVLDLKRLCP